MREHFTLGIGGLSDELSAMRSPGCYWVIVDNPACAEKLSRQSVIAQPAATRLLWVAPEREAEAQVAALPEDSGPGGIRYAGYPRGSLADWVVGLAGELQKMLPRRRQKLWRVMVSLPSDALDEMSETALAAWCRRLHEWVRHEHLSVLFVSEGRHGLTLRARLTPFNDAFDGLAHLQAEGMTLRHLIVHWRNDYQATGLHELQLKEAPHGWSVMADHVDNPGGGNDEHEVIAQQSCLERASPVSEHWHVYATQNEVVTKALRARAATVVLGISESSQVEKVARDLHNLRLQRGGALKLVVRELVFCLRQGDMRLLQRSGANRLVLHHDPFTHFLIHLETLQGQRTTHRVDPDFDHLRRLMQPSMALGAMAPNAFVALVGDVLERRDPADNSHLLVSLRPSSAISAAQALSHCHIVRHGDIATVFENNLYLFLFGCHPHELDKVLARLFGMPANEIFVHHKIFSSVERIQMEIVRLSKHSLPDVLPSSGSSVLPKRALGETTLSRSVALPTVTPVHLPLKPREEITE